MKKRLLFAFMAMCVAVSGFALTNGEFVYTPQGRFQVMSDLVANSNFADLSQWEVITATAGKTVQDNFTTDAENGPAAGVSCAVSLDATAGEGMYFKFTPTSAGNTYVVSFKMKGAVGVTTRTSTIGYNGSNTSLGDVLANGVKVFGNSEGTYSGETDVVVCNEGEELTEEWQTFNYAIVGDGTARTYFIAFTNMATNIYIADLQIAEALQVADLRARDAALEKINVYKNAYAWPEDVLEENGINDALEALNAITEQSAQSELDEALTASDEILKEFLNSQMDDYLASNSDNHLGNAPSSSVSKGNGFGDWTGTTGGRCFWSSGAYPELGHYQRGSKWNYGDVTSAMGVYMNKTFDPGSYVFSIEGLAAMREDATQTWYLNEGLRPAYGVAYIVKVEGEETTDTLISVVKDLDPIEYTPFYLPATIAEAGTYQIGLKAYCKEAYQDKLWGSVVYVKDAYLWVKNENKYNQKQLGYEADVREQIKTGRDNLTTAAENIANAEKPWGKADLQACVDTVEVKIAAYETLSQDDIIATYEDFYEKKTGEDVGLMVYTVYQEAVKDIIAANRKFNAVNDTLASMQTAIDAAENTMAQRVYDAATGKDALTAAINKAKETQTAMKAAEYSVENAAAIVTANAELADAVEIFKTTVPASAMTTVVDIDFENTAVQNQESLLYTISGNAGTMEFSRFSTAEATDDGAFEQGLWLNGEQLYKGYLRVGNGEATVNFDPTNGTGSMGNNIIKISCDFFLQGLSSRYIGFITKDESGENTVAAFYANYYNNTIDAISNLPVELSSLKYGSGGSYNDGSPEGAEPVNATALAKNSFEVILDYGEGSMYVTTVSGKGTVTTAKKVFDKQIPRSFILKSNYDDKFATRRCWFDNLKIETIQAGPAEQFVGIENAKAADAKEAPVKVFENGQIIIGGKYNAAGAVVK